MPACRPACLQQDSLQGVLTSLLCLPPPPLPSCLLQVSLLNGQKLQGVLTSDEVQAILGRRGWQADYPLFTTGGWGWAGGCWRGMFMMLWGWGLL